jgi:hypothetical protein
MQLNKETHVERLLLILTVLWAVAGGCSDDGEGPRSRARASTLPQGRIVQSATYRVQGFLAGGAQAPENSAFATATILAGTGTSILLERDQLVLTGNVSTASGGVPFFVTATVTATTSLVDVTMTLGVGTTFVGSGTVTQGLGNIDLALSNGTSVNFAQESITRFGNTATTLSEYDATLSQGRCDGTTDTLVGPLLLGLLPEGTFALIFLAPANMVVATGARTDTTLGLASLNLANGNVGAGTATTTDGFKTLSIGYQFCDSAGGCVCPAAKLSRTSGTALRDSD